MFYSGQNKNTYMMQYLSWRVATGRSHTIELNFMIAGDTKFGPDQQFGTIKKHYRRTLVSSVSDISQVGLAYTYNTYLL